MALWVDGVFRKLGSEGDNDNIPSFSNLSKGQNKRLNRKKRKAMAKARSAQLGSESGDQKKRMKRKKGKKRKFESEQAAAGGKKRKLNPPPTEGLK